MPNIPVLPTVTSIVATDPQTTDLGTVHYTVTFSEAVTGVTADQFSLTATGRVRDAAITDVTPVAGSNGTSYIVTASTGSGNGTIGLAFTGNNVHDANGYYVGPFKSESNIASATYNYLTNVAVGDLNGDGKADLVTRSGSGTIDVKINDGNGNYTSIGSFFESNLDTPVLGDVNGDGKLDLLYTGSSGAKVYARLGNGDGTFAAAVSSAMPASTFIRSLADFNGDGKLDALFAWSGKTIMLAGNGDGIFGSAVTTTIGNSTTTISQVVDVNGDGKLDVLTWDSNATSPTTSLRLGNGDGSFGAPTLVGQGSGYIPGDFNGDGKTDLAVKGTNTIAIRFGNGDGTFGASQSILQTAATIGSVGVADFNGDGKDDLVISASNNTLTTYYGRGDGSFVLVGSIPLDANGGISVKDLNGDGKPDVVFSYANYNTGASGLDILTSNPATPTSPVTYNIVRYVPPLTIFDDDVTSGADGNSYINAAHFYATATTLTGDGTAGEVITVIDAATHAVIGTATVGGDGRWSISVSGLQDGTTYNYVATTTDVQGNSSAGPAFTFKVDATAPVLTMTSIGLSADASSTNPRIDISGTSSTDGSWQLNGQAVPYGISTLAPNLTDVAGNVGALAPITLVRGYTTSAGTTLTNAFVFSNGVVVNGSTVVGTSLTVAAGSTSVGATLFNGAIEELQGGSSIGSVVKNGAVQRVITGNSTGATIEAGGYQDVRSGATLTDAVVYGFEQVYANGTATHTTVKAGGTQFVANLGHAVNTVVESLGTSQINAGADERGATIYGVQYLSGTSYTATIGAGGVQYDYGKSNGALVQSAGIQHVYQGGSADGTTVAVNGYQDVYQASVTNTVLNGQQQVLADGHADGTTINAGAWQYVGSGGATTHTTIGNGGTQYDQGTSSGALVQSGGNQHVYQGGTADATTVAAGGYQDVYYGTATNTVLNGQQQVLEGGSADDTIVNAGGRQYVGSGGAATGTTIATGGFQYVDAGATDSGAIISGGWQYVAGSAAGAIVSGRGQQDVAAGGTATNSHLDGGTEHVYAGGLAQNVDFDGSAGSTLVLDAPMGLTGTIANFGSDDYIDFRNTVISSVDIDGSNNLTVTTDGGQSYSWALLGQYAASSFVLASDGNGGTALSYVPQQQTLLAAAH